MQVILCRFDARISRVYDGYRKDVCIIMAQAQPAKEVSTVEARSALAAMRGVLESRMLAWFFFS